MSEISINIKLILNVRIMVKVIGKVQDADIYMIGSDEIELGSELEQKTAGRVLRDGTLFEPRPIQAIAARYVRFGEHTVSDDRLEELLNDVEVRGPAIGETPYRL
jgi:hypothetical protein